MTKIGEKQKILVVAGPTASGKTSLAIKLAKRFSGEVISADSRQVYRGLDIGTAKVTEAEMDGVPHHILDVADVDTVYSADDFKRDGTRAIEAIIEKGHLPIIAGGTFFYVDVLLGKTSPPEVPPNPALRTELETKSLAELQALLAEQDPRRATTIDTENPRRLIRALEVVDALGAVPPLLDSESPYGVLTLGIKTEKAALREKFRGRAEDWASGPFEAEVRKLLADGVTRERLSEIGFEYLLMLSYIDGKLDRDEFIQRCIEKNWQYAKRQNMWLKRDETIKWFEADNEAVFAEVERFLGR